MKILVIGQAAFGQDVFNRLREAGHDIVGVVAPAQSLSGRADRLRAAADAAGSPGFDIARVKDPALQAELRSLGPDLGVMAFVSEVIPLEVLNLPRHGTIQYHPSLLPLHRGRSAINWAIIQGDAATGVSIFWPDAGLDTGPLLLQREVAIGPDDTTGGLYYEKLYPLGLEMFVEAVELVAKGDPPRIEQDESRATYDKPCTDKTVRIDWRERVDRVYNLIRGADPSPGAWTRLGETTVKILDARRQDNADTPHGVVAAVSEDGVLVGADGGGILVRKLQAQGAAQPAHEAAAALGIVPGTRFLNPKRA